MTPYKAVTLGIMLAVPLGVRGRTDKQSCEQMKAGARQQVEARWRGSTRRSVVAATEKDGTTHEFKASKETLQDLKVGDNIEARLRELPKC
jgi:hypothetical protein